MTRRKHLETMVAYFGTHTGWSRTEVEAITLSRAIVQMYAVGNQRRNA